MTTIKFAEEALAIFPKQFGDESHESDQIGSEDKVNNILYVVKKLTDHWKISLEHWRKGN